MAGGRMLVRFQPAGLAPRRRVEPEDHERLAPIGDGDVTGPGWGEQDRSAADGVGNAVDLDAPRPGQEDGDLLRVMRVRTGAEVRWQGGRADRDLPGVLAQWRRPPGERAPIDHLAV